VVSCIRDSEVEAPKVVQPEQRDRETAIRSEPVVVEDACQDILSSRRLGGTLEDQEGKFVG
jgi:hypothetical protein